MSPVSEKKRASNAKWDAANLKRMSLAMPLTLYNQMQDHVNATGETINGFIKRAIASTIKDDNEALNKCNGIDDASLTT